MNEHAKKLIRGGEYAPDCKKYPDLWVQIRKICTFYLCEFAPASIYEDIAHNTDAVLRTTDLRIAIRIRDPKYYNNIKFRTQFTLRAKRPECAPTEYQKIIDGWGDCFLYGFANDSYTRLLGFFILNLHELRRYLPTIEPIEVIKNEDGSSAFYVYSLLQFPQGVIIAASRGVREALEFERSVIERHEYHVRASFEILRRRARERESRLYPGTDKAGAR